MRVKAFVAPLDVYEVMKRSTGRKTWQVGRCRQCDTDVVMHWSPSRERYCPGCGGVVSTTWKSQFESDDAAARSLDNIRRSA